MRTKFNLAMFLTGFAMTLHADSSQRGFTVSLRDCTELIGLGPVEFAKARSVVPIRYSLVPFNGGAGLVVRASRCAVAGVDSSAEKPAIVAQVGIAIIPPDGTGDINNYTLLYATDHQQLAQALNHAGLPVVWTGLWLMSSRRTPMDTVRCTLESHQPYSPRGFSPALPTLRLPPGHQW